MIHIWIRGFGNGEPAWVPIPTEDSQLDIVSADGKKVGFISTIVLRTAFKKRKEDIETGWEVSKDRWNLSRR
jgi:hypothetical protein